MTEPGHRKTRVGIVQMRMGEDPAQNMAHAQELVERAAGQGAEVVCLPELFRSRYFCQSEEARFFDLAEPIPGPSSEQLAALCARLGITLVASLFERRAPGLYHNTAIVVDGSSGMIGKYRKMHIPDDPRYYEKYYFTPGDLGFRSFATARGNLGVLVCWDQWYPEAARLTALKGAEILFYPTAIGWHPEEKEKVGTAQHAAWETIQRSHAVANGCYVVAVNRIGFEPDPTGDGGIEFWGQSFVTAPDGTILCRLPQDEEAIEIVELDLSRLETQRQGWPFLRDRRVDAYEAITRRYLDD